LSGGNPRDCAWAFICQKLQDVAGRAEQSILLLGAEIGFSELMSEGADFGK